MKETKKHLTKRKFKLIDGCVNNVPSGNITYLLAFIIPLLILVLLYYIRDIFPFGKNCYLRSDMYHQYAPFFSELWHKIRNGETLLYTWDNGMGTNFISLMAYYLASPTNWIIALFPQEYVIEIMNALIILKLSGSSLTFCYYITKHFNTKKCTIALFGIFYALSGYVAAYSWNVMWLDCILLLPLIMLGLERLVKQNKGFMYCITLGLCIFTNYYIAIMVCLSVILYFVVLMISYDGVKSPAIYIKKIFNWGFYSLLSGGLAACLLLPEIYTFSLSASSSVSFPKKLEAYFSILEMLVRQLINVPVHLGLDHHPNIYCGVAIFLFIPLYIMCKKINSREKIGKCFILLIFLISYNLNILNFIWHGLHFPNSLPCRQAFIYIFFLLTMSYEALAHIKSFNKRQFTGAVWIAIGFILLAEHLFRDSEMYNFKIFYISGALILIYALLLHLHRTNGTKGLKTYIIVFTAFTIGIIECAINMDETGIGTTSRTAYMLDYNAVDTVTNRVYEADSSFYRMDKITGARSKNDGSWHNYPSISTFSSTSSGGMSKLYKKLGLVGSTNAYSFDGSTMLTNSLFSVKYLISNQHLIEDSLRTYYTGSDGEFIYQNHYTLPLGYMVPNSFSEDWDAQDLYNGIENQNSMIKAMTGVQNVFEQMYEYRGYSEISFKASRSGHMYVAVTANSNESIQIYANGELFTYSNLKNNLHVLDAGYVTEGDNVEIYVESPITAYVYSLNEDNFIEAYNILNSESYNITEWTDTHFKGTVDAKKDGTLLLSIPYDEGWSVYVDGKKTDIFAIEDALTGVYVTAGHHEIELKYMPVNFIEGCILTALCIIILIAVYFIRKCLKNGKINTTKLPITVQYLIDEEDKIIVTHSNDADDTYDDSVEVSDEDLIKQITEGIENMNDFDNIEIEAENDTETDDVVENNNHSSANDKTE